MPPGFDDDLFNQIDEVANLVDDFEDGMKVAPMDGIDFQIELPKLNGGPLLWEMIDNMQKKRSCLENQAGRSKSKILYFEDCEF
jgi:hypothetical protein